MLFQSPNQKSVRRVLCFRNQLSHLHQRFSLQLDIGEHATDYSELAKQEHLSAIEVEVRKLNDKIRSIRAEAQYQKDREAAFRDTSESINSRVLWWAVFQSALVVAAAVYQLLNLKNFFKSKKLA